MSDHRGITFSTISTALWLTALAHHCLKLAEEGPGKQLLMQLTTNRGPKSLQRLEFRFGGSARKSATETVSLAHRLNELVKLAPQALCCRLGLSPGPSATNGELLSIDLSVKSNGVHLISMKARPQGNGSIPRVYTLPEEASLLEAETDLPLPLILGRYYDIAD